MLEAIRAISVDLEPATLVMGACAASTLAIGLAVRWLAADACDLVLAGGFDAVSTLVAAGFEVLRATSSEVPPRPFRTARDGMALGEGAALVALRPSHLVTRSSACVVYVTGFGASCDAVHLTAPDRTGTGLASAAGAALREARVTHVDLVSPHGSATPFSDAAEARALAATLPNAETVVIHPFKAQIGHTLGASGVLETLACVDALVRGVYPAAAGAGEVDPDARATLLDVGREGAPQVALKLSAAFGGANAALVLSRGPRSPDAARTPRRVYVRAAVHTESLPAPAELASRIGWPIERVLRADSLTRWVLATVATLVARQGPLRGAGVVVGTTFATLETDASFFARIQERGVRMAEPRRFPYTSPNAAAGDASVAFGLTGPGFAVGSGQHAALEALVVASHLVGAGDADAIVVVGVDDAGPTVSAITAALGLNAASGAVGLVVSASPQHASARVRVATCGFGSVSRVVTAPGHLALLPLVRPDLPCTLTMTSPDASHSSAERLGWARIELVAATDGEPSVVHAIDATHGGP
jgi:3-oxoacyl-[acyl-carrier-protein] synthase-1/3-oxoacyl-[acyl-carrier-protein] synthase II